MKATTGVDAPFAGGVYLKTIALYSTNAQGDPIYVKDSDAKGFYHKTVVIDGFGGYWSVKDMVGKGRIIAHENKFEWRQRMDEVLLSLKKIKENRNDCDYRHVIAPCTIRCKTVEAHGYDDQTEMPRWDVNLTMTSCNICFIENMLHDTSALAEISNDNFFHRPKKGPVTRSLRRAWWRYAISQVRYAVAQRRIGPNGTLKRTTARQWRETIALYNAHCTYRKYITQLSKCNLSQKKEISILQKHLEYIERYELGIKGIIHARRVVMSQYMVCVQLMRGETPSRKIHGLTSSSSDGGEEKESHQSYLSSAYDWWYGVSSSESSNTTNNINSIITEAATTTTTTTSNDDILKTASSNNRLVDVISDEALSIANYLNVHCTVRLNNLLY
jgi:hypothetical protein